MSGMASLVRLGFPSLLPAREDVQVTRARVLGTSAWVAYTPDRREARRRKALSLGAVVDWDLLDTLMDLPEGMPVPLSALSSPVRRRVARAAPGVARVMDGQVVRYLVPAVTPLLAVVTATDWGTGLARASRFASYCRRMVLSSAEPASGQVVETAGRLGIGLAVQDGSGLAEFLLEPEPVLDWQPTTAWWRFCEVIWDQAGRS